MKILITGGTGFIGRHLCGQLLAQGHEITVLTRRPDSIETVFAGGAKVLAITDLQAWTADHAYDAVINLAGEPIMARRWSKSRKQVLWDSRVTLTQQLVECIRRADIKPSVFISGSAIGIYGDQGDLEIDESCSGSTGFGQQLCREWETAASAVADLGVRVCLLRTGLVVGSQGGFLRQMLLSFRLGLGGRIGTGRQWMSWVHLDDHIRMTQFLLDSPAANGAYNVTSPNPVTNSEFTRLLAKELHRPAVIPVPAWLLKLAAGEMSELLLGSQRVLPRRALVLGFKFNYETLEPALRNALGSQN